MAKMRKALGNSFLNEKIAKQWKCEFCEDLKTIVFNFHYFGLDG